MLQPILFWLILRLAVWPLKPSTKDDKVEILGLCGHFGASSHWDVWSLQRLQPLFTDRGNESWTSWRTQAYSFLLQCMPSKFNGVMLRYVILVTVYYHYVFIVIRLVRSNVLYNRLLYVERFKSCFNNITMIVNSIVLKVNMKGFRVHTFLMNI